MFFNLQNTSEYYLYRARHIGHLLGEEWPIDLESLYKRIVVRRRGGYCFKQNDFLYEILQ